MMDIETYKKAKKLQDDMQFLTRISADRDSSGRICIVPEHMTREDMCQLINIIKNELPSLIVEKFKEMDNEFLEL